MYLRFPYNTLNPTATKAQTGISYFEQWDNSYCSLAKRISPVCRSLYGLFLWTNSIPLKTAENRSIAPLLGWLALCTMSNTHLHLRSLNPITKIPRTATQIPPETAKIRVCWLLKRRREQSKQRCRKRAQLAELFTSFLPLQQSQLNQRYTDQPLTGYWWPSNAWVYFIPVPKIQRLMRLDMTWNHVLNSFKARL